MEEIGKYIHFEIWLSLYLIPKHRKTQQNSQKTSNLNKHSFMKITNLLWNYSIPHQQLRLNTTMLIVSY